MEFALRFVRNFHLIGVTSGSHVQPICCMWSTSLAFWSLTIPQEKHSSEAKALFANVYNYFDELTHKWVNLSPLKRTSEATDLKEFLELYCDQGSIWQGLV